VRVTMICQRKDCQQEFHDLDSYYAHVESHEMEKKANKENE
jgi:hypothetical protein